MTVGRGRGAWRAKAVVAIVAAALVGGALYYALSSLEHAEQPGGIAGSGRALVGGPFSLIDQNGARRLDADFRGKFMLVYFGYTHCPDACPTALQSMSDALDALGNESAAIEPVFITVDPARDTPEHLKLYLESFHPRMVALTGSESEIASVAKAYRIFYAKAKETGSASSAAETSSDSYLVDHSSFIYLMGRDGRYLTHFPGTATADQLAEGIRKYL